MHSCRPIVTTSLSCVLVVKDLQIFFCVVDCKNEQFSIFEVRIGLKGPCPISKQFLDSQIHACLLQNAASDASRSNFDDQKLLSDQQCKKHAFAINFRLPASTAENIYSVAEDLTLRGFQVKRIYID